jgi:hypothetical protein
MFEPPINSVQIQTQFASRIFNSNYVWNLNIITKGKLFLMLQYMILESLVTFEITEGWIFQFRNSAPLEILKNQLYLKVWARPMGNNGLGRFKPTAR